MKKLGIIYILLSNLAFGQEIDLSQYKEIPQNLQYIERLYKDIVPAKNYKYWAVFNRNAWDDWKKTLLYSSSKSKKYYREVFQFSPPDGIFPACMPMHCFDYIVAIDNNQSIFITNYETFRSFLGYIDNLSEALLLQSTYNLATGENKPTLVTDLESGTINVQNFYKIEPDKIYLYRSFLNKESKITHYFLVEIDRKTQKLEIKKGQL